MQKGSVLKLTFHRHDLYIVRQVSKCKVVLLLDQWWTWHDKSKKAGMPGIWPPSSSSSFCAEMPVWTWPLHGGSAKAEMNALLYSRSRADMQEFFSELDLCTQPLPSSPLKNVVKAEYRAGVPQVNFVFAFNPLYSDTPYVSFNWHSHFPKTVAWDTAECGYC